MNENRPTILNVDGMTCPSCVRHVTEALCELDGVGKVDVALRAGTVAIEHDPAAAPIARLIEALREAGYDAQPQG